MPAFASSCRYGAKQGKSSNRCSGRIPPQTRKRQRPGEVTAVTLEPCRAWCEAVTAVTLEPCRAWREAVTAVTLEPSRAWQGRFDYKNNLVSRNASTHPPGLKQVAVKRGTGLLLQLFSVNGKDVVDWALECTCTTNKCSMRPLNAHLPLYVLYAFLVRRGGKPRGKGGGREKRK